MRLPDGRRTISSSRCSPWIGHSSSSASSISRRFAVLAQPEAERGPPQQRIEKEGGHRRDQRDEEHTLQDDADHVHLEI